MVRTALADVHFFRNEQESFLSEAEAALSLNPNAPAPIGLSRLAPGPVGGKWERGIPILEKGIALNPHYPGWFHVAPYCYLFLQDRCEEAYQLKSGRHFNRELQKDFNETGKEGFSFDIVDYLKPKEDPNYDYTGELKVLEEMWLEKLGPYNEKGYNTKV